MKVSDHSLVASSSRSDTPRRVRKRTAAPFRKPCRSRFRLQPIQVQNPLEKSRTSLEGPFGEVLRATGPMARANPFRFSTKYQDDETDLLYYGLRFYNASTARWINKDPIEEDGGLNLYAFVQNDAVRFQDALGQKKLSLAEMEAMLVLSVKEFRLALRSLCSPCDSYTWNDSKGGTQTCTYESCHAQADALARDYAHYLRMTFVSQYRRFGNVTAFTIDINTQAHKAPNHGMIADDYDKGYGLKCSGMQSLMMWRFWAVEGPLHVAKTQCFKAARVGNNADSKVASHNWYAIYPGYETDIKHIGIVVDPWYSAGGIISPESHISGTEKYFYPDLW